MQRSKPSLKICAVNFIITSLTLVNRNNKAMQLTINDEKTKELLTEVLVEMLQQKREVFYEIVVEALEDVGLANAIVEGRQDKFVSEDKIMSILEG